MHDSLKNMVKLSEILQSALEEIQNSWSNWLIFETLNPILLDSLKRSGMNHYCEKIEGCSQIISLNNAIFLMLTDMLSNEKLLEQNHEVLDLSYLLQQMILTTIITGSFHFRILGYASKMMSMPENEVFSFWYEKLEEIVASHNLSITSDGLVRKT